MGKVLRFITQSKFSLFDIAYFSFYAAAVSRGEWLLAIAGLVVGTLMSVLLGRLAENSK
jgi:hypothetical protein